ncbi:MAG TPA: lysylphosphatidylglycerol synthase transmembrane domain-containing protein [Thermoleophilaceae bacterium]|jgi:hypothetical protein|nr:lysylphosphatidylglycerol synthase transmembrane domain-containing protein [Thermoleophilaceae bacterium]
MAQGVRLGDRVEQAIEEHADAELEIARGEHEAQRTHPRSLRRTIIWLAITGISLYLVAPSVLDTLASWRDIKRFAPQWLLVMLVAQTAAMACLWALQHIAIGVARWSAVITSQLAGNAMAKVAPGGGAVGSALQYRMLVTAEVPPRPAVSGLTAANVLTFAVVLALPVLAIPALIRGSVDRTLTETGIAGLVVFVVLAALGVVVLALDGPLRWIGRTAQRIRNRVRRNCEPLQTLPDRLIRERDRLLNTLGPRWKRALLATVGRWAFDYATLLAALAAVGVHARPALVLLAFCAAQLLAQIPITPGGLGFVEAGLTAMLSLAGVGPGNAVLATFAYRLFSYWLPMPVGLGAWVWHRRRYGA